MTGFPPLGRHNSRLKSLRSLDTPGGRAAAGLFLLEGVRVLEEALQAGLPLDLLLVSDRAPTPGVALAERAAGQGVEVRSLDADVLERLAPARTSQGLLAAARLPSWGPAEALRGDLVLVLEGVQDPGNVGSLLRTAWGAGAGGALLVGGADPFNARAVRAAAGAVFRLPVARVSDLSDLERSGHALVTAEAHGGEDLFTAELPRRMALVLGAEVEGVSAGARGSARLRLTVPLAGGCESLNVGAAGALVLFEHRRRCRQGIP